MSGFFPRKAFHEGTNFFGQKIVGEVVPNRRTNVQIMPRFESNLNAVNLYLKIKPWPLYKIMKVFILKVLIIKKSQKLCHVQFPLC